MDLNPIGDPPSRFALWCPRCRVWIEGHAIRRCPGCFTAVVRQTKAEKPRPGELRPGIVAEFADPRDRYDPSRELAELRARLAVKVHEVIDAARRLVTLVSGNKDVAQGVHLSEMSEVDPNGEVALFPDLRAALASSPDRLRECALALIAKLDVILPEVDGLIALQSVRSGRQAYHGPNIVEELKALREACGAVAALTVAPPGEQK